MSSRLPRVVVWRSEREISELKDMLFDSSEETCLRALAKIKAYQTRGQLPHSVEATALLISSAMSDTPAVDSLVARMAYSMSIIRFVNGLLDPSQQATHAIPLHALAKQLDLPSSLVELRHAATHEYLPSLEVLRLLNSEAIAWLRRHYWDVNAFEIDDRQQMSLDADAEEKNAVKELFREWRRLRRVDPLRVVQVGDGTPEGVQFWRLVKKIRAKLEQDDALFIDVLVHRNVLIPAGADGHKKVAGAIRLFWPLLEILNGDSSLLQRLCGLFVNALNSQATVLDWTPEGPPKNEHEASFYLAAKQWLLYLLNSPGKNKKAWISETDVVEEIAQLPRTWNVELLQHYAQQHNDEKIASLANAMQVQVDSLFGPGEPASELGKRNITHEVNEYSKRLKLERDLDTLKPAEISAWTVVPDWTPRPIGVL